MFDQLFGTKDERLEEYLYSLLAYSLGLPSSHALTFGVAKKSEKQPLPISTVWYGNYVSSFRITGKAIIPQFIMNDDNQNIFNKIDRNIAVPNGKRYAFDFSGIQEGKISADLVHENSAKLKLSDECRKLLNIIYQSGYPEWNAIPLVYAEHGAIYVGTGIPDRIYLQLPTKHEASAEYRNTIIQNIAYSYSMTNYDHIAVEIQQDRASSSMNFQAYVKQPEPHGEHQAVYPENFNVNNTNYEQSQTQEAPSADPQFPFDYYRSIGLIDDDGMVTVQTFIGPLRVPANSESGMEYLLKFGQQD